jgi:hypothetical protein
MTVYIFIDQSQKNALARFLREFGYPQERGVLQCIFFESNKNNYFLFESKSINTKLSAGSSHP